MFDIYMKEIKLVKSDGTEETYKIKPLSGKHLPKVYSIMSVFEGVKDEEDFSISTFDEDTISNIHLLAMETFKKSYPGKFVSEDELNSLDEFVSQNLLQLLEGIMLVNLPQK